MGRSALVTPEQVSAAVLELQAEGKSVSVRSIREKLGNIGSMVTIHKLAQPYLKEKDEAADSLRQLPPEVQKTIFTFADKQSKEARREIAEELLGCKQEMTDLEQVNEQLAGVIDELREQLAASMSERANVEGRGTQLIGELAAAREELVAERRAAEVARVEALTLQLRVEALAPLEDELRQVHVQCEAQRSACVRVEQLAAVLEAQKLALDNQVQDLKNELANSRATINKLETTIMEQAELRNREREVRAVIERDLAVAIATRVEVPSADEKVRKGGGRQEASRQGDLLDDQVSREN